MPLGPLSGGILAFSNSQTTRPKEMRRTISGMNCLPDRLFRLNTAMLKELTDEQPSTILSPVVQVEAQIYSKSTIIVRFVPARTRSGSDWFLHLLTAPSRHS